MFTCSRAHVNLCVQVLPMLRTLETEHGMRLDCVVSPSPCLLPACCASRDRDELS
jgi:hypothetical protein